MQRQARHKTGRGAVVRAWLHDRPAPRRALHSVTCPAQPAPPPPRPPPPPPPPRPPRLPRPACPAPPAPPRLPRPACPAPRSYLVAELVLDILLDAAKHERLEDHVEARELALVESIGLPRRMAGTQPTSPAHVSPATLRVLVTRRHGAHHTSQCPWRTTRQTRRASQRASA